MLTDPILISIEHLKTMQMKSIFHSHPHYELFYFHEGSGNYLIGDQIYSLSAGDLIYIKGMTLHCPNMSELNKYVRSVVSFDPYLIRAFAGKLFTVDLLEPFDRYQNFRINLQGEERQQFEARLAALDRYFRNDTLESTNRFRLFFLELLLEVRELHAKKVEQKPALPSKREETAQKAISFIGRNFAENISMDHLAGHLHLNKHYLSRVFKEVTGVTLFDYLYQRRINEAKIMLLLQDGLAVTEVCYQVGFRNLSHFSRIFKERVGVTPDQYKRQVKKSVSAKKLS